MTDQIDNWHKLARYDTNMQGELHANLLRNNDIKVSVQALSSLPGMNSGAVLWVQDTDLAQAQRILASINTNLNDADLIDNNTIVLDGTVNRATNGVLTNDDNGNNINKGGNA